MKSSNWLKKLFKIKTFSPSGFISWAVLILIFFLICHVSCWREHTTFISGTAAEANETAASSAALGMVYLVSYFAFVLVAPILVLASGIFAGLSALTRSFTRPPDS